jgi:ADP-ribose pyrophosphatase YjhB (NUDIX family)
MFSTVVKRILRIRGRLGRKSTLGVRGVVRRADGAVLLVRHTYLPGWYLPGGGVEADETAAEAFVREVAEETGVRLTAPPRLVSMHVNPRVSRRDHVVFFVAEVPAETDVGRPDLEIAEAGFFAPDALPEGITPATRRRLDEVLTGAEPSRTW